MKGNFVAIDIGNTNVTVGLFSSRSLIASHSFATDKTKTEFEYFILFKNVFNHYNFEPSLAVVSSVVPNLNRVIDETFANLFSVSCRFICTSDFCKEIEICTHNKSEVGIDRLVNAVSAKHVYNRSCIVVDFGTTITFDVVLKNSDESFSYTGGVIVPGINLSIAALRNFTAKLPQVEVAPPSSVIGKTTSEAINSGIFFGYSGLAEKIISKIKLENRDHEFKIILTGGMSFVLGEYFDFEYEINHDITLLGIAKMKELFF